MSTVQTPAPKAGAPQPRRSWVARHKILTSLGIVLVALLVGVYFLGWPLMKLRFHSTYSAALNDVRNSPVAVEKLGEPIEASRPFPGGSAWDDGKSGEAMLNFPVKGPRGTADVSAFARMLRGQWSFTQLKLTLPNHEEIDINKGKPNDVGAFDPNAKPTEVAPPNLPLNIDLPQIPTDAK
jgi:hypothetical protein